MYVLYTLVAVAAVALFYLLVMLLRARMKVERPEKLLGARLQLAEPDGLGSEPPALPEVVIREFREGGYLAEFVHPLVHDGREERFVDLRARHAGYPLSSADRHRILAAGATLESGTGFVTIVRRSPHVAS